MKLINYVFGITLVVCITSINAYNQQSLQDFAWYKTSLSTEERINALIGAMTLEEKVSQLTDFSAPIERLGVPEYNWWNECLHGVARNGRATVFPQAIGMAATFDTNLINRVGTAISDEARAKFNISVANGNRSKYAGLTFWTPNINIFRDPRWGRGQECYGEDPYLTARMGVNLVRGIQGDNPKYLKAAACAKHYAVHSGPEELRHEFDAIAPKKDFYETYLPAFEALVVEAKVEAVMGAYNRVYGEPACGSKLLLQDILRDKWGFEGHVVSDCWAISDFHKYHKVTKSEIESAVMALKAGVDLNCGNTYPSLVEAVKKELVEEELINKRLHKLLETRFKLGFFDPTEDNPYNAIPESVIASDAHSNLALEVAQKSLVLLKNKNETLPLKKEIKNLYIVGPQANNSEVLLGNYYGMSGKLVNILEGITGAVSAGTTINYKQGCLPYRENVNPIDWTTGEAKRADAIIAVMGISGLMEGEEGEAIASSTKGDNLQPVLPANQVAFLKKLRQNNKKPVIVVMTGGSPMIIPEVYELADALVWAWYPGQEGGTAVADIIFGDVSPSGKLPLTFPMSMDQLPDYNDYSMKGRTYKYLKGKPLFTFGFGLSYSSFEYSNLTVSKEKIKRGSDLEITAKVKNTGAVKSGEVAQVYIVQPGAGDSAPIKKLVGFTRVDLEPGKVANLNFKISAKQMEQYDTEGVASILKGEYNIIVGGSSPSERSEELGAAKPVSTVVAVK